jgi:hypothetical protein
MMKGLAVLALLLSGCDLYFGGDDDVDPPCYQTGGAERDDGQRDPYTGECQWNYPCGGDACCYETADSDGKTAPEADWGACYSQCTNLEESACMISAGCFAAYIDNPAADGRQFWGCWQTAPSGPIQGQCSNLDAWSCSRHDDCKAIYSSSVNSNDTKFQACEPELFPEPQACDLITCPTGYHCDQQCSGGTDCKPACVSNVTCAAVDCAPGYTCAELCGPGPNGTVTCGPACVPTQPQAACSTLMTETSCIARADCVPVYDGDNCTCYPNGCECQVLTYARCEGL